ncbi:metallophosphoesterase family protein [Bifidobacterium aesculapii]|uniref:metallophosphoesterase family protein n=1 Tax=Bifidobacterium aesculapii TaxID=1329411 RepID=UPI0006E1B775|nr:exonuclease subunit SbcD [Bifidobacterium aesculapii]
MRVLHTSDWHIGRRFKGVDLLRYQRAALEWLISLIEREHVDVLCVSGDVYDLSVPSAESVRLFDEMFARLGRVRVGSSPLEIVITPGNHDSAIRLGAGAGLMLPNVHMRCGLGDIAEPVLVERGGETLAVYTVPYLDPDTARPGMQALLETAGADNGSEKRIPRSHEGMMRAALTLVTRDLAARRRRDPALVAMLMAHAFVSGASPSDSERAITVGGVDSVPASLFSHSGLDYLALGHLHRPQRVNIPDAPVEGSAPGSDSGSGSGFGSVNDGGAGAESVSGFGLDRTPQALYSGSLLAYSFSESHVPPVEGNGKSVVLFDIDGGAVHDVRTVDVQSGEPAFVRLEGTASELLGDLARKHRDDWVSITVHVNAFPQGIYQKLDDRYAHALEKNIVYDRKTSSAGRRAVDLRKAKSHLDVVEQFVRHQLDRDPDEVETKVLRSVVETVEHQDDEHATGMTDTSTLNGKEQ